MHLIKIIPYSSQASLPDQYVRCRGQSYQDIQGQQPGLHHGGAAGGGPHGLALAPGPGGVCAEGDSQGVSLDRGQQALPEGQGGTGSPNRGKVEKLSRTNLMKMCM